MEVVLGKIVNTYGLKGALKVYSFSDFAAKRYTKNATVTLIHPQTKDKVSLKVATYTQIKGMDILTFYGLEDINLVEKYVGYEIFLDILGNDLPKDSYYYGDLINCEVYNQNQLIGHVIQIQDCGNQQNLRIQCFNKNKTFLYPFINHFLKNVDVKNKRIDLNPIEGMIPYEKD